MTRTDEIPFFPVPAPEPFADPASVRGLTRPVLDDLARVVGGVRPGQLGRPTPCAEYDVAALRDHVLGWLQFMTAAMADPRRETQRLDPVAYRAADDRRDLAGVVVECAGRFEAALAGGALGGEVVMSQARMAGPAVAGMFLGEYLVHGWDLAAATGQEWAPPEVSAQAGLDFFAGMVAPEYRGGPDGYFAAEVPVPDDAPALARLIGFAGRDPGWAPPAA